MQNLAERTAIITGASGGIGPFISRALADEHMNLVLAGLSARALEELANSISKVTKVIVVRTDVAHREDLERVQRVAKSQYGVVDLLVNNAGIEMFSKYHTLGLNEIELNINVNLTSAMILTRMLLPEMLSRGSGHIINMSSLSAKAGPPCAEPYTATKAALIAFTESLRAEYRGSGVSASVICPGFVTAGIYQRIVDETGLTAPLLLGTSSPESVAQAILRAVKKDIPEIVINPGPVRLLSAIGEISPPLGEWIMRRIGVVDWFMKVSLLREQNKHQAANRSGC
jgi:short-subunit dehydrogenase